MAPEGGGDRDRGGKEAARVERSAGWWRSLRGVPSRAPSLAVERSPRLPRRQRNGGDGSGHPAAHHQAAESE